VGPDGVADAGGGGGVPIPEGDAGCDPAFPPQAAIRTTTPKVSKLLNRRMIFLFVLNRSRGCA
jgi:hypothetical protein